MPLHVVDPGLLTLVVDLGRPQSRSLGVPVGGAADRAALMLGNALVGNPPGAAALEIALAGPTLRTDVELGCVVFGAPFALTRQRHAASSETSAATARFSGTLQAGKTFTLLPGDELRIGGTATGVRGYLCVRGGLRCKSILGSQSSLQPLRAGTELECTPGSAPPRFFRLPAESCPADTLRALPGTQAAWFHAEAFFEQPFTVTPASNRMGLRLKGKPLPPVEPGGFREMVSEPVAWGAVQVTRDGQCIVLGVDGQTIGGFPKVAHVISADLDRLAQLRPGQTVRFTLVSHAEAEALHHRRQALLREWLARLQTTLTLSQ